MIRNYDEGKETRTTNHEYALLNYRQIHTDYDMINWLEDNPVNVRLIHPQNVNNPEYISLFSAASQYVYGNCMRECLDKAMQFNRT